MPMSPTARPAASRYQSRGRLPPDICLVCIRPAIRSPRRFGRAADRGFPQSDPRCFLQKIGPLLEAVADRPARGRQLLDARRQPVVGQPDLGVPGAGAFAADAAVGVGPVALDRFGAVAVEAGGAAAAALGARADVAPFCSRGSA